MRFAVYPWIATVTQGEQPVVKGHGMNTGVKPAPRVEDADPAAVLDEEVDQRRARPQD